MSDIIKLNALPSLTSVTMNPGEGLQFSNEYLSWKDNKNSQLGKSKPSSNISAGTWISMGISTANALAEGFGVDNKAFSKEDANTLRLSSAASWGNDLLNKAGLGFLGVFGKNYTKTSNIRDAAKTNSAYANVAKVDAALERNQGRHLFGSRGLSNTDRVHTNNVNAINNIMLDASRREANMSGYTQSIQDQLRYAGHKPGLTLKTGGSIPELDSARASILSLKSKDQEIPSEPQKFQLGGKMNMIVTGALHARKHNLEELNPVLEDEITKKGIPVVVMNEGGEVQGQQAEVESGEIIMNFDTTKTIEDYYDEYNSTNSKTEKNKIALECGKYLVNELLKNTDDPDKLIKKTV